MQTMNTEEYYTMLAASELIEEEMEKQRNKK
jgi:hypothetical protein